MQPMHTIFGLEKGVIAHLKRIKLLHVRLHFAQKPSARRTCASVIGAASRAFCSQRCHCSRFGSLPSTITICQINSTWAAFCRCDSSGRWRYCKKPHPVLFPSDRSSILLARHQCSVARSSGELRVVNRTSAPEIPPQKQPPGWPTLSKSCAHPLPDRMPIIAANLSLSMDERHGIKSPPLRRAKVTNAHLT